MARILLYNVRTKQTINIMTKGKIGVTTDNIFPVIKKFLYSDHEIFLREIISNAVDATQKLKTYAQKGDLKGQEMGDLTIRVSLDKDKGTLTISDRGIGMTEEEIDKYINQIAFSGANDFLDKYKNDANAIIGHFGLGFYSAFMVADTVTVISKKYGSEEAWKWTSSGADGYTMEPAEREGTGTDVIMTLKADAEDEQYSRFLKTWELQKLVKKYSDYIRYPIKLEMEKSRVKEETKDSEKPEYETYTENETLNSMVPLWQRAKKDITPEEYNNFYKEKFFDFEDPIATIHVSVEGAVTYKALLYIPARAPYDFYTKDFKKGLQLYSSGVMIMENCEELLPDCFRFVRGVVDSQDLSLNISREMLQHDRQLKFIAANLEKKIKAELAKLMESDREKYEKFYAAFGMQIKYGVLNDYGAKKELLQDLLLYWSHKQNKLVSFKEYADAMPEEQKYIYFASGENRQRLSQLPQLEKLTEKGFDVLLMTDEVDSFVPQTLGKYADKDFRSVTQEDLGLSTDEEKKEAAEQAEKSKATLEFVKTTLGDAVKEVRLSDNLGTHPVCMVPEEGMTFEMEKYFQRLNPEMGMKAGRILELNPNHRLFGLLQVAVAQDEEKAKKIAKILYAQALLMADLPLENPGEYTDLVCELVQ